MRYKPQRDIPSAVRELKSLSPTEICNWIRNHRTKKNEATGRREQVIRNPPSISNFFKRHPKLYKELQAEIAEYSLPDVGISEADFSNGAFRKIPSVEKWILQLRSRGAKEATIKYFIGILKNICRGQLPHIKRMKREKLPAIILEDWGLKHPRALTLEDCQKFNSAMRENKCETRNYRLVMRNFLRSRNIAGWDTISGRLAEQKGKYAHLYAKKEEIAKIFDWLKSFNYEAYLISKFSFKCGGVRALASLEAHAKYVNSEDRTIIVFEKSNRNAPKRRVVKEIPDDFYAELEPRIKKGGKLFNTEASELRKILRASYKAVIPHIDVPMPFHFWRHQFAQHMLRATDWNYALVADLGGWKIQTLQDYYGAFDRKTLKSYARQKLAEI